MLEGDQSHPGEMSDCMSIASALSVINKHAMSTQAPHAMNFFFFGTIILDHMLYCRWGRVLGQVPGQYSISVVIDISMAYVVLLFAHIWCASLRYANHYTCMCGGLHI